MGIATVFYLSVLNSNTNKWEVLEIQNDSSPRPDYASVVGLIRHEWPEDAEGEVSLLNNNRKLTPEDTFAVLR